MHVQGLADFVVGRGHGHKVGGLGLTGYRARLAVQKHPAFADFQGVASYCDAALDEVGALVGRALLLMRHVEDHDVIALYRAEPREAVGGQLNEVGIILWSLLPEGLVREGYLQGRLGRDGAVVQLAYEQIVANQ